MPTSSRRLYVMPTPKITQELLARFVGVDNEYERVSGERAELAARIFDLFDKQKPGDAVEAGLFSAHIREDRTTYGSRRVLVVNGKPVEGA